MADLAGFDAIIEIHKDTIIDWVNLFPVPKPGGPDEIRLLGGPFSVELPLVVPYVGSSTIYLILNVALEPLVHQSAIRLVVTLRSGTCVLLGRTLNHVGGSLALDVPLVCRAVRGQTQNSEWQIFMQTPLVQLSALQLDDVTLTKLGAILNSDDILNFTNSLARAIWALLPSVVPFPAPLFYVVPGVDSQSPLQFSSVPTIAWIDSLTLGLFGSYFAGAGGSVSAKKGADLPENLEFMYGLPGPEPMVAARYMALLLSATAAHQVLFCPLVRDGVVRPLKLEQQKRELATEIHSDQYQKIYDEQFSLHYASYLIEELRREDASPFVDYFASADEVKRAKLSRADARAVLRVQGDVQSEIYRRADILMALGVPPSVIAEAVPPPCGTGNVEAFKQPVDVFTVQSDFITGVLRKFDLVLDEGRLLAHYEADAFIEEVFGDVEPNVEGEIAITMQVEYWGSILAHVNVLEPRPGLGATGLIGVLANILKGIAPGAWAAMLTIVSVALQQMLQAIVDNGLGKFLSASGLGTAPPSPAPAVVNVGILQQNALNAIQSGASDPTAAGALQAVVSSVRARDIQITRESFALFVLVARNPHYNLLQPSISLPFEKLLTASSHPSVDGTLHLPKTAWGCREATFDTTRVFWDTEIRVKARYHDLDMPLIALRWSIDIGNFTFSSIGSFTVLNPGIKWSGAPAPLQAGVLDLSGVVNHPDSPLTRVDLPSFAMGHLLPNADIQVTVSGDGNAGWSLRFRGTDGNFYVRLMLDAIDGLSQPRHGEAIIEVKGDELQLNEFYAIYRSTCDAKYKAYRQFNAAVAPPTVERVPIAPGQDVTRLQEVAQEVHRLIEAGDPSVVSRLEAIHRQFGSDALRALPRLASGHLATKE